MQLSQISPDFERFVANFQSKLAGKDAWQDLITASTGQTFIEFISEIGAYDQLAIQRAWQEGVLDLARLSSSVVWITRMFGVHVQRRNPAWTRARLSRAVEVSFQTLEIAPYTQFFVDGAPYFNRDLIIWSPGQIHHDVTLFEGEVIAQQFISDGTAFQNFVVGTNETMLSDADLVVLAGNEFYTPIQQGLWLSNGDEQVVFENTLPDGNILLQFGDGSFGKVPTLGTTITIQFVRTNGKQANTSLANKSVNIAGGLGIEGHTTAPVRDGYNEKSAAFYKAFAPALFAAGAEDLMVRRRDHNAVALKYPGVIDCKFLGQAETHPEDVRWMGAVTAILLTENPWGDDEWEAFVEWYKKRTFFNLRLVRSDPAAVSTRIEYNVYGKTGADLAAIEANIKVLLRQFFTLRAGSLGFGLELSDMDKLVRESSPDIDYIRRVYPLYDIEVGPYTYITATDITVEARKSERQPRIIT